MAIIVDPDNLDRNQVIFGTASQKISLYPVGNLVHASATDTDGATTGASVTFTDGNATFQTWGVAPGDVLCIYTGADAGHYTIDTVSSETTLTVETTGSFTTFTGSTGVTYHIRDASGGSIADGVTLQALYSFGKEEWRVDSAVYGGDNLIRHEFPFEAITSEQFESGGGISHDSWVWFNDYTRKKVRTAGWAEKNNSQTTLAEYAGVVTLGNLDADTQVYYQQIDDTTAPANFTFQGAVNEPLKVWSTGDDRRTYLKLFARKKGRTYAQAAIADIGVTNIQTIANRFPLAHSTDSAIAAKDGELEGSTPWTDFAVVTNDTDGQTNTGNLFTDSNATFLGSVVIGDTLHLQSGTDQGHYRITAVTNTTLTVDNSETGNWAGESTLTYRVLTRVIIGDKTTQTLVDITDGSIVNVDGNTGTLTSATGGFSGTVAQWDLVIITEAASTHRGVYTVVSVDSDTQLTLNTVDHAFPGSAVNNLDFRVVEPGMYLQYKQDDITLSSTGNLTFSAAGRTIVRSSGDWGTDGVTAGSNVKIVGSGTNDGVYTVLSVVTSTLTLVTTDALDDEGPVACTATAFDAFKRTINGVKFGFHWRLLGNVAPASKCYEFLQHQLRQTSDIDWGPGTRRGDVTDALMTYSTPTGVGLDMIIDDIGAADTNNVTYRDVTGTARAFPFVAAGNIQFNVNLTNDASAVYTMFFSNDDAGDNTGRDFGTPTAIIVKDAANDDITGSVSAQSNIVFNYDYDGNVQRGGASAGVDAPVTLVALGLNTAQYVIATGTIARSKANNFSLVAALERNYSNP